ncbi:hypothetical protein QMK17_05180 [Rhodococcus sp. G-MC3]|uniref:hypothetical protein n=1 Tax=Rhodococcus sp. G-MC3 TaxID=3046209 RepID=UPI0024B96A25|nr:hypothetical protein [Rhodococcus sp. G-MC3]MDJ0392719.1 hypothetical protein [Rhodococcus sp. G-MC3]
MSPEGGASVDKILDDGAAGLLYFERYLPILHRVSAATTWTYTELCARYDQQRGLNLACLSADAKSATDCAAAAGVEVESQEQWLALLRSAWKGPAGEQAAADIASDVALARGLAAAMDQLGQVMGAAGENIRTAVADKAAEIGRFDPTAAAEQGLVDGKPLPVVECIDALSEIDPDVPIATSRMLIAEVAAVLPAVQSLVPSVAPGLALPFGVDAGSVDQSERDRLASAKAVCADWLRNTFAPIVSGACQHFAEVCGSTDTAVRSILSTVATVAEGVDAAQFPPVGNTEFVADSPPLETDPLVSGIPAAGTAAAGASAVNVAAPGVMTSNIAACDGRVSDAPAAADAVPGSPVPSSPMPNNPVPNNPVPDRRPAEDSTPENVGTALETLFGRMPTCDDLVGAIEKAGAELTDRLKSALDDAMEGLTAAGPDAGGPAEAGPQEGPGTAGPGSLPAPTAPAPPASLPLPALPPAPEVGSPVPVDGTSERGHLEAALDGHSARIALTHNGTVSLELGTPDGASQHFEVRPGPFGLPVIVQTDGLLSPTPGSDEPTPAVSLAPGVNTDPRMNAVPADTAVPENTAVPAVAGVSDQSAIPAETLAHGGVTPPSIVPSPELPQPPISQPPIPDPTGSGAHLTEAGPL